MDLEVISKLLLMQTLLQRTLCSPSLHAVLCLVAQSCLTLCDPMDCSPPGSSVHGDSPGKNTGVGCHALLQGIFPRSLLKLMRIKLVMPSNHLILCHPLSSCPQSFPASGSFQMCQLFTSGGQSIGISASASE